MNYSKHNFKNMFHFFMVSCYLSLVFGIEQFTRQDYIRGAGNKIKYSVPM